MANCPLPSPEVLRQLLRYQPETGRLFWKERPVSMFPGTNARPSEHSRKQWNSRCAGKRAFASLNCNGYPNGKIFGRSYLAHRVIWKMTYGQIPDGQIDHVNGDKTDNRLCNLRIATAAQNQHNRPAYRTNQSGRKGVSWHKRIGKWQARICLGGKLRSLGYFSSLDEAAEAYDRAALELHGEFARTNAMVTADASNTAERGRQASNRA